MTCGLLTPNASACSTLGPPVAFPPIRFLEGIDDSPPLSGDDFLWDWNELSVGDLFERIRVSMPDGKENSVTKQEKADVLAFVLQKNDFPTGETEIEASTQALRPIAFLAVKP